jgi:predicted esterase
MINRSLLQQSLVFGLILIATSPAHGQAASADLPPDIADMQVQEHKAGGDAQKTYFVIRRPGEAPKTGWKSLFVLPGGDGSAEFKPFITRIAKHALPEGYLAVQLVAPVWDAEESKNAVWPTEKLRVKGMKFTTAEFFDAVRAEVEKADRLDPRYVFTLTWSSSGTNGYLLSLLPKAKVTGTFVAMSVFHPQQLGALDRAKKHPYFIYHSPQDFIPIAQAESARDALTKAGAAVELQRYEGGHGWRGDTMGDIRKGIEWLEQQATKPKPR